MPCKVKIEFYSSLFNITGIDSRYFSNTNNFVELTKTCGLSLIYSRAIDPNKNCFVWKWGNDFEISNEKRGKELPFEYCPNQKGELTIAVFLYTLKL